jgi:hypothetical protein
MMELIEIIGRLEVLQSAFAEYKDMQLKSDAGTESSGYIMMILVDEYNSAMQQLFAASGLST